MSKVLGDDPFDGDGDGRKDAELPPDTLPPDEAIEDMFFGAEAAPPRGTTAPASTSARRSPTPASR